VPALLPPFAALLQSADASLVCALKVLFAVAANPTTAPAFAAVSATAVDRCLNSACVPVATLAASVAVVHVQRLKSPTHPEPFLRFLRAHLDPQRELAPMALRLCGSLACSARGALFLEEHSLFDAVAHCLDSSHRGLAIHVFAAASAFYPLSPRMLALVPAFFSAVNSPWREPAWVFLANIAVHPQAAVACARKIAPPIEMPDAETAFRVLTLISRIAACEEGRAEIDDARLLTEIVRASRTAWDGEHAGIAFRICEAISVMKRGRRALRDAGFSAFAVAWEGPLEHKASLMRTVARLGRRK
jgi:hypothetical protein